MQSVIRLHSNYWRISPSQSMHVGLAFGHRGIGPCSLPRMVIGP
ncbi:Uncharacterised protein [Mycobacteroides abscessus subsp. abscessus]|nr:Uncharacterised protein [Mycobacteroides abscessus subsp. abscessus]